MELFLQSWNALYFLVFLLSLWLISQKFYKSSTIKLPPGSHGLPLVGESLSLFWGSPLDFLSTRRKRFGGVFWSNLLGSPTIVATTVESAKFFLSCADCGPSGLFARLIGPKSASEVIGSEHALYRRIILGMMVPETLKCHVGFLSNQQVEDNLMTMLFGGHHTTALALMWLIKHLNENPQAFKEVEEEQRRILLGKRTKYSLTWEDTRQMPATLRAVHESLRLSNVVGVVTRKITKDISYKGYTLPKDWMIHVYMPPIHLDDSIYPNAAKFNPSRFEVPAKTGTFIPFGYGDRICPGRALSQLEQMIFIHRLITKYRWEPVNLNSTTSYWPMPSVKDGYLVHAMSIYVQQIGHAFVVLHSRTRSIPGAHRLQKLTAPLHEPGMARSIVTLSARRPSSIIPPKRWKTCPGVTISCQ
ncbi:hypothetical protein SELMODRAFT_406845 [Selaginella moellendorffii]|uniref:Uncharacterized protein CYP780A7 n=1 Tax=Selaginella moellendorffii TaxID=88036 RepID=D8R347_SELML|nr:hypothetical protein SELMODRAFT_406845 [Selaginella moellendorffii]